MSRYFTKPNLFTPLIVIAAFGFAFRAANIATHRDTPAAEVGMVMTASAVEEKPAEKKADAKPAAMPVESVLEQPPAFSSSEIEVLQSLSKRRAELAGREKTLSEREALLKAAEQEVDSKITELAKLKADMEKLLGQQKGAEEGRVASLVKIYENMKPGDAARIFDQLDMEILLDVIGRMNERKVSPVLAGMNPQKAKDVTIRLAEQRKLPEAAGKAVEKVKSDAAP